MSVLLAVRNLSPRYRRVTALENLATFCTATAEVLDGGVLELPRALRVTSITFGTNPFRAHVQDLIARVDDGATLAEAMEVNHETFPSMLRQMVQVGETTETLPEMLRRSGEFYALDADRVRNRTEFQCPTCKR